MFGRPQIRYLDFQPVLHEGQTMWYLRDPLELTQHQLVMPHALAQLLVFCDGTRTVEDIHAAFCRHVGQIVPLDIVTDALSQLDEACLLANDRSQQALAHIKAAYRNQSYRPAALADLSYPGSVQSLAGLLNSYSQGDDLSSWPPWTGRGLISPHIDYRRGGPIYAKVWRRAKAAILDADLVIIFGTDHNGGPGTFTLTRLPFATPYGVLPVDTVLIDSVAAAIGPEVAYADELHHRLEHSIELSAVWLHHIYRQAGVDPKPMIPILTGSFQHYPHVNSHPDQDETLIAAIKTLQQETAGRRVLAVASVDFAHVGPAFGDSFPLTATRRSALRQTDDHLLQAIVRGDAACFYDQLAAVENNNRVCGFSSIYLMLQYLGVTQGVQVAYDQCAADDAQESWVSIAGVLLD